MGQIDFPFSLFKRFNIPEDRLTTFIHPLAYVAPNAYLGPGIIVMPLFFIFTDFQNILNICGDFPLIVKPTVCLGYRGVPKDKSLNMIFFKSA